VAPHDAAPHHQQKDDSVKQRGNFGVFRNLVHCFAPSELAASVKM